jgi:hypothetical protein
VSISCDQTDLLTLFNEVKTVRYDFPFTGAFAGGYTDQLTVSIAAPNAIILDVNVGVNTVDNPWTGFGVDVTAPSGTVWSDLPAGFLWNPACAGLTNNTFAVIWDDEGRVGPLCVDLQNLERIIPVVGGNVMNWDGEDPNGTWMLNVSGQGTTVEMFLEITYMAGFPMPEVSDNCGIGSLTYVDTENINPTCQTGTVTRTWTVVDACGLSNSCDQTITIDPLPPAGIPAPGDLVADCPISYDQLLNDPDAIGDMPDFTWHLLLADGTRGTNYRSSNTARAVADLRDEIAIINAERCAQLAVNFEDQLFDVCLPHGFKIRRTWTVVDWCDPNFSFTHVQTIKVEDIDDPVVIQEPQDAVFSIAHSSCLANIFPGTLVADDNCDTALDIDVSYSDANGGDVSPIGLPIGTYTVTYTITDDCGNSTETTSTVSVVDNVPPQAHCIQDIVVSLTADGWAEVCVDQVDNGSGDDCGPFRMEIMIEGNNSSDVTVDGSMPDVDTGLGTFLDNWGTCHRVDCGDLGTKVIKLRIFDDRDGDGVIGTDVNDDQVLDPAVDQADNYNECWGYITIEDKNPPVIVCPPDVTVDCSVDLSLSLGTWTDIDQNTELGTGIVESLINATLIPFVDPGNGYAFSGCEAPVISYRDAGHVTCVGTVSRTWRAVRTVDNHGTPVTYTATCTQVITVIDDTPAAVEFPSDITINCVDNVGTEPSDLKFYNVYSPLGDIIDFFDEPYLTYDCEQLGVSRSDEVFDICAPGSYKIKRSWRVIDWCNPDFLAEHEQIIFIEDNHAPELTVNANNTCITNNDPACHMYAEVTATATDDCSAVYISNDSQYSDSGSGADASGVYPKGRHTVTFTAIDDCGNVTAETVVFEIIDCKAPQVNCANVTIELKANLTAELLPENIDAGSFDNCSDQLYYLVQLVDASDSPLGDPAVSLQLDCSHVPTIQFVRLWVFDGDPDSNGSNGDYCVAQVDVTAANDSDCSDPVASAFISGTLRTNAGSPVSDVEMFLDGNSLGMNNGAYQTPLMNTQVDYTVAPEKLDGLLDEVTTWDIVQIRKHILNATAFENDYLHVAADINNDLRVSTSDILYLRQAILGVATEFPNGQKSWRFVDATYDFPAPNPLAVQYPENISMMLMANYDAADFVGVKIGDLSGDINARSSSQLEMVVADEAYVAGNEYVVDFRASDFVDMVGYQFTLNFDNSALEFAGIEMGELTNLSDANFGLTYVDRGMITTSWDSAEGITMDDDAVLFSVRFRALANATASESMSLSNAITQNEAYDGLSIMDVAINFEGTTSSAEFALYQNAPNPFSGISTVGFVLPMAGQATLTIYDVTGKVVKSYNDNYAQGYNEIQVNSSDLKGSGVLYYELVSANHRATKKMIILE